jgi:hypothetical protein
MLNLGLVHDFYRKSSHRLGKNLRGQRDVLQYRLSARRHARAGEWEAELLDRAHLIRHVQASRENMASYKHIDRLIRAHPDELGQHKPDAQMPQKFLFFVGYGRSGHSLVGSLLDAHPKVAIAHELNALKHFKQGYSYEDVVMAAKYNAYIFHHFGRNYTGYDYVVPGQHQGRFDELEILGDKKGNGTARQMRKNPWLIDRVEEAVPVPYYYVHVIRNPFDNIATRATRRNTSLRDGFRGYFLNVDLVVDLKKRHPGRVLDVYLDDLMESPQATLTALLQGLGVATIPQDYLDACASILFTKPSRTREKFSWDSAMVRDIEARFREVDFLRRFAS